MKELQTLAIKNELCFEVSKQTALAFVIRHCPPDLQQLAQRISERHRLVSMQQTHRLDVAYCSFAAAAAAAAGLGGFGVSQCGGSFQSSSSLAAGAQNATSNSAANAAAASAAAAADAAAVGVSQCDGSFQPFSSSAAGAIAIGAKTAVGANNALCAGRDDGAGRANSVDVGSEDQCMGMWLLHTSAEYSEEIAQQAFCHRFT